MSAIELVDDVTAAIDLLSSARVRDEALLQAEGEAGPEPANPGPELDDATSEDQANAAAAVLSENLAELVSSALKQASAPPPVVHALNEKDDGSCECECGFILPSKHFFKLHLESLKADPSIHTILAADDDATDGDDVNLEQDAKEFATHLAALRRCLPLLCTPTHMPTGSDLITRGASCTCAWCVCVRLVVQRAWSRGL